MKFENNCIFRF